MDAQTSQMLKMLDAFSVDILLKERGANVIVMDTGAMDKDIPEDFRVVRVLCARGQTIAMAVGPTLYVKPDYFKGGKHYNIFVENEIKLMLNTYGLKTAVAIDFSDEHNEKFVALDALLSQSKIEKDPDAFAELVDTARLLSAQLDHLEATKRFDEINQNYMDFLEATKEDPTRLKAELRKIVMDLQETTDVPEQKMIDVAMEGLKLSKKILEPDGQTQADTAFLNRLLIKSRSGPVAAAKKAVQEDLPGDNKNKAYLEVMRKGENAFNAKDFKKARRFFSEASQMAPKLQGPKDWLTQINEAERLSPKPKK